MADRAMSRQSPADDAALAAAAAAGDGGAFAALYERYERRAYNLALRVTGSDADAADATQEAFLSVMRRLPGMGDRELSFGSYLFTATRNACYDLMEKGRRARPSDTISESAVPVGVGAGDPGDPERDPDRRQLLSSQREEIRAANDRLPERQREALALRELEELSYDEIAAIMGMNRNSVAQLISRARIGLRDELRGTALAALAASAPECERALPLIAMRDDGQLDPDGSDGAWLAEHLAGCERCPMAVEAMQEAGASYRAWAPVAAAPWLLRETMARAAELTGSDWSEEIEAALARRGAAGLGRRRRRLGAALAGAAALLLGGVAATVLAGGDTPPPELGPPTGGGAAAAGTAGTSGATRPAARPETRTAPRVKSRKPAAAKPEPRTAASATTPGAATVVEQTAPPPAGTTVAGEAPEQAARPPSRRRTAVGGGRPRGARPEPAPEPPSEPAADPDPPPEEPQPTTTEDPPTRSDPPSTEPPPEREPPEERDCIPFRAACVPPPE